MAVEDLPVAPGGCILMLPEETESGSAGTQPDKGYSGLRCAKVRFTSLAAIVARDHFFGPLDIGAMP